MIWKQTKQARGTHFLERAGGLSENMEINQEARETHFLKSIGAGETS
jgi:hypothetical protein